MANYNGKWTGYKSLLAPLALTEVDFFNNSKSYYGCRDMGGNVNEWTTTLDAAGNYIVCGGSYKSSYEDLMMIPTRMNSYSSETESPLIGFRIVARNLKNDDIVPNQTHDSKSSVTVDHAAKAEQNKYEQQEVDSDLLWIIGLPLLIILSILSVACCSDPTGNRAIGIIGMAFFTIAFLCDLIQLLGLDFLRWMTK